MNKKSLEYKGFTGTIEYSKKDKVYFGKVINIDGLISYEGATIEKLNTDFKDAIADYLDFCERV